MDKVDIDAMDGACDWWRLGGIGDTERSGKAYELVEGEFLLGECAEGTGIRDIEYVCGTGSRKRSRPTR